MNLIQLTCRSKYVSWQASRIKCKITSSNTFQEDSSLLLFFLFLFAREGEVWHQIYDYSQYGSTCFSPFCRTPLIFKKKNTSNLCLQDDKQICSLHALVTHLSITLLFFLTRSITLLIITLFIYCVFGIFCWMKYFDFALVKNNTFIISFLCLGIGEK